MLRRGSLQQIAPPRELYESPRNVFVAGFIGAPPMNLVPAIVEDGGVSLPFARLPVAPEVLRRLRPHAPVVAGIRPEHLEDAALVAPEARGRGVTFEASVDVTEWLGGEQLAYVPYDAQGEVASTIRSLSRELEGEALRTQLVVSLDAASAVRGGTTAKLWLDPRRLHLFDVASGESLTRPASPG